MNEGPLKSYFRVPNTNIHLSIYTCTFTYIYVYIIYIYICINNTICMHIHILVIINIQQRSHPAILPERWDCRPLGTLASHLASTNVVTSESSERKSVLGVFMGGSDHLLS